MALIEERRKQLDGIVSQMTANKETDKSIQMVVDDFKAKYGKLPTDEQAFPVYGTPPGYEGRPSPTSRQISDIAFGSYLPFITQRKPGQPLYGTPETPTKESVSPPGSAYAGTPKEGYKPPVATAEDKAAYEKLPDSYLAQELPKAGALALGALGKAAEGGEGIIKGTQNIIQEDFLPWARGLIKKAVPEGKIGPVPVPKKLESFGRSAKNVTGAPQPEGYTPRPVESSPSGRMPRGGEVVRTEQQNVAKQGWDKFRSNKTPEWDKMNLNNLDKDLIEFTEPGPRNAYSRLNFKEKEIIENELKNIDSNIHPTMRTGKTKVSAIDVGHPERMEGGITRPSNMDEIIAERLRLGDLAHEAYMDENRKLGEAYKEIQGMFDKSIKQHLSKEGLKDFNIALRISTRQHIMTNVFGEGTEKHVGQYDWTKVQKRLRNYPSSYIEKYFQEEASRDMYKIRDAGSFKTFVEKWPVMKYLIPAEFLNEVLGIKLPTPSVTHGGRAIFGG